MHHMKTVQTMIQEIYEVVRDEYKVAQLLSTDQKKVRQPAVNRWRHGFNQAVSYQRYMLIQALHKKTVLRTKSKAM